MKIVTRKQLMAMPAGTIFSNYKPVFCKGLFRKGETWETDFLVADVIAGMAFDWQSGCIVEWSGDPMENVLEVSDVESREGLFDDDMIYAVYEPDDIQKMVSMLTGAAAKPDTQQGEREGG